MKKNKPILAIDWNDTIQDQTGEVIAQAKYFLGADLSIEDFDVWCANQSAKLGMRDKEFVDFAWRNRNLQRVAKPFPGVATALRELSKHFEIVILTATAYKDLVEPWLKKNGIYYDRVEFGRNKCEPHHVWDILIDDKPKTLLQGIKCGRRVVKNARPWNASIDVPAIENWVADWKKLID